LGLPTPCCGRCQHLPQVAIALTTFELRALANMPPHLALLKASAGRLMPHRHKVIPGHATMTGQRSMHTHSPLAHRETARMRDAVVRSDRQTHVNAVGHPLRYRQFSAPLTPQTPHNPPYHPYLPVNDSLSMFSHHHYVTRAPLPYIRQPLLILCFVRLPTPEPVPGARIYPDDLYTGPVTLLPVRARSTCL
jgi:hypothetical protein